DQGWRIFGTLDPSLEGVSIPFTPPVADKADYDKLRIQDGHLVLTRKGKDILNISGQQFIGITTDLNRGPVILKIQVARAHTADASLLWEYQVTADGHNLCDPDRNIAFAVPAAWYHGQFSTSTTENGFTFACIPVPKKFPNLAPRTSISLRVAQPSFPARATDKGQTIARNLQSSVVRPEVRVPLRSALFSGGDGGVAAKCIESSHYAPWLNVTSRPGAVAKTTSPMPTPTEALARGIFNVCVQAMTADYLGDGQPYTIDGTRIALFDLTDVPTEESGSADVRGRLIARTIRLEDVPERQYDGLQFEGVWVQDKTERRAKAVCLAKDRWQTLVALDHFKFLEEFHTSTGHDCEHLPISDLDGLAGSDKLLLVSYSAINDRSLYWFPSGAGGITTTHVQPTSRGFELDSGLHWPACNETPCTGKYIGNILAASARFDKDTIPLYLYKSSDIYATTSKSPESPIGGPPFSIQQLEGFLFAEPPSYSKFVKVKSPVLRLWQMPNSAIYCTTAEYMKSLSGANLPPEVACGHLFQRIEPFLGYLIVPGLDIPPLPSTPVFSRHPIPNAIDPNNIIHDPRHIIPDPGPEIEPSGTRTLRPGPIVQPSSVVPAAPNR
ncbi:MAG TPA: ADYC domain-containing protein, partial [Kofleriaceae bacterium]|nr:ADYC domain-containing protein [Kofleriaceae bacterium]